MAPIQMSMLSGVPYTFRNFLAKFWFLSTWLSCARFLGCESPQKRRQALYPEGKGAEAVSIQTLLSSHYLLLLSKFLPRALWEGLVGQNRSLQAEESLNQRPDASGQPWFECMTLKTEARTREPANQVCRMMNK